MLDWVYNIVTAVLLAIPHQTTGTTLCPLFNSLAETLELLSQHCGSDNVNQESAFTAYIEVERAIATIAAQYIRLTGELLQTQLSPGLILHHPLIQTNCWGSSAGSHWHEVQAFGKWWNCLDSSIALIQRLTHCCIRCLDEHWYWRLVRHWILEMYCRPSGFGWHCLCP